MLKFYYSPAYKYSNRRIIDLTNDTNFTSKDYENIDSPDTINGHIIYTLTTGENIPTYIYDTTTTWRWFVSGITQLRSGKFQISLLRDIISENPTLWKNEEAYITAGVATNYNKYKTWNLPFTNTKIREQKLTINGKPSFFIYYVNTQNESEGTITESDLNIKATVSAFSNPDYTVSSLSEIPEYQLLNAGTVIKWLKDDVRVKSRMGGQDVLGWDYYHNLMAGVLSPATVSSTPYQYGSVPTMTAIEMLGCNPVGVIENTNNSRTDMKTAISNWLTTYKASLGSTITLSQISSLEPYVGKIIYNTGDQKIYKLNLTFENYTYNDNVTVANSETLQSAFRNINWPSNGQTSTYNVGGSWVIFKNQCLKYTYTLEELGQALSADFTFSSNVRKLPKSAVRCVNIVSDNNFSDIDLSQALMAVQANTLNLSGDTGRILDIQYLPFSVATSTNSSYKINNTSLKAQSIEDDDLQYVTNLAALTNINKETDSIKIVSPSRASQFVFKPYNNDGNMTFNTKITLKPYTSVIYIRPQTTGLLINNWDDKDCLIISEDFSLTQINSEWANYVYQNRNYQNAFNRQIQGREYERTWERKVEEAQAKSDEWTARNISAQKASTYTGNIPLISSISAAIGTSVVDQNYMNAAKLDREYNEAMYQESVSLAKDNFQYQLDNIKSQPLIPSKITVVDCKLLDGVYLEYYSTNPTELEAIEKFYKYNGNRIDDYGTFSNYWGWFIRGKIIISNNYTQPELNELNRRLATGIFTEVAYA